MYDKSLVVKTISGLDSTFIFTFAPKNNGTHLTIEVDYELPGSILGKLLNKLVVEERNERDLEVGLQNLKAMAEAEA